MYDFSREGNVNSQRYRTNATAHYVLIDFQSLLGFAIFITLISLYLRFIANCFYAILVATCPLITSLVHKLDLKILESNIAKKVL